MQSPIFTAEDKALLNTEKAEVMPGFRASPAERDFECNSTYLTIRGCPATRASAIQNDRQRDIENECDEDDGEDSVSTFCSKPQ